VKALKLYFRDQSQIMFCHLLSTCRNYFLMFMMFQTHGLAIQEKRSVRRAKNGKNKKSHHDRYLCFRST
jgi:hypothetical protein